MKEIKIIKYEAFDGKTFENKTEAEEYEKKTKDEIIQRIIKICFDSKYCQYCPLFSKTGNICLIPNAIQPAPRTWDLSGD